MGIPPRRLTPQWQRTKADKTNRESAMCKGRGAISAGVIAACVVAFAADAAAADFTLQGKTVTVIVSGGIGGGLDAYTRTLLPHFAKHLPGQPTMVVQNMPGGGGVQGVQRLY